MRTQKENWIVKLMVAWLAVLYCLAILASEVRAEDEFKLSPEINEIVDNVVDCFFESMERTKSRPEEEQVGAPGILYYC